MDREQSKAPHLTFSPQIGDHRRCDLSICTFHLGFSLQSLRQAQDRLSDPGMEDLLYEAESVRRFVGLSLSEALPDETTILNFRHLLERHELGKALFYEINAHLESQGLRLRGGKHRGRQHHRGSVIDQEPD